MVCGDFFLTAAILSPVSILIAVSVVHTSYNIIVAARQNVYLAFTLLTGAEQGPLAGLVNIHGRELFMLLWTLVHGITLMAVTNKSSDVVKHTYKLYVIYCVHFD